jgi:enediyne biosynthesis protein E4
MILTSCFSFFGLFRLIVAILILVSWVASQTAPIRFQNVARSAGFDFILENNPTAQKHAIETMPGGVAAFDYDGDGLTDIYVTNGAAIPSMEKDSAKFYNRLYRNNGGMKFTDVTEQASVRGAGYSMGVAVADYNNDGHVDIFIAGVNRNILYRNTGKGGFEDATAQAAIQSPTWSVAAGWFDYDNDGWLDLFIVNYAKWSLAYDQFCGDKEKNVRVYCHPKYFEGLPNTLYRNRGNGTFEDVSKSAGILKHASRGMSVAFADYDQDGHIDAFVTNDKLPNSLFRNRGNGTFEESGLAAGVALLEHGKPVSSMGVDFRDYDNDGLPDINVTALASETFPLFHNDGGGFFTDKTFLSGLGPLSAPRSGWSNGFFDFNNDGWKDLFSANSHVNDRIELFEATEYKQPNSIFANVGAGRFRDVSREVGGGFEVARAHRGSAFADFNRDGRMDIVVTSLGEPVELWENVSPNDNHWLFIKPVGTRSNRDGIGTRIRIGSQSNLMTTSVGYASSSRHGVHFGLGNVPKIDKIEILWPSGKVQVLKDVAANQVLQVQER